MGYIKNIDEATKDNIVNLHQSGMSILAISRECNMTVYIVTTILKERNIQTSKAKKRREVAIDKQKVCEYFKDGMSIKDIANKFDTNNNYITKILNKNGIDTSHLSRRNKEIDREKIVELYNSGKSAYVIADELGVSTCTVYRSLEKYNVPVRTGMDKIINRRSEEYTNNLNKAIDELTSGERITHVSKRYGICKDTLRKELVRQGKQRETSYLVIKAMDMYESGIPYEVIRKATGVSKKTIENRLANLKLLETCKQAKEELESLSGTAKEERFREIVCNLYLKGYKPFSIAINMCTRASLVNKVLEEEELI